MMFPLHCDFSCRWPWPISPSRLTCCFSCILLSTSRPRRQEDAAYCHPRLSGNDLPDSAVGLSDHAAAEEGKRPEENGSSLPKRGSVSSSKQYFKDVGQKIYL